MATMQQLESALMQADAAGDTEAAQIFANEIKTMRQQQPAPVEQPEEPQIPVGTDVTTGAPMDVRTAVGAAKTPQDKLATLQNYYPDAQQIGENYVYTDPETGNKTLLNPEGIDMGDVGEHLRLGFETLGGAIGGVLGAPAGPGGMAVLGGTGMATGGAVYDWLAQGLLPVEDTRGTTEVIGDAGIETATDILGGKAGEVAGKIVQKGLGKVSNVLAKPIQNVVDASKRVGTDLPAGTITGSKTLQVMEEALAKLPISSDIIGKKYSQSLTSMKNFAEDIAGKLSPETGETAVGLRMQKGVETQVNKFKAHSEQLYNDLWNKMPKDERVPLSNTKQAIDEIVGKFEGDPEFAEILNSKTIKYLSNAVDKSQGKGGATVNTLKALRTKIGGEIEDKALLSDTAGAEIKQIYAALSRDLEDAAASFGPETKYAFDKANNFYKGGREIIDNVFQPVVKSGIPETVYRSVFGQEGAAVKRYPATQLKKFFGNLDDKTKKTMAAEFVRRMGAVRSDTQDIAGDVFSPQQFMKNWTRMPEEAKSVVFDKGTRSALDDLATLSNSLKERAKVTNYSNTAPTMFMMQYITAPLMGYGAGEATGVGGTTGAAAFVSPVIAAKLMTSKPFIRWVTRTVKDGVSESSVGRNIGQLLTIAEANPSISGAIYEYARALESSRNPQVETPEQRADNEQTEQNLQQ